MAPSKTKMVSMEVDVPLRRSARIAKLQEVQQKQQVVVPPVNKTKQKRVTTVKKTVKKVIQECLTELYQDFDTIKISDVFKLVKKYETSDDMRKLYYLVVQHIVRNTKNLHINNLIKDVYENRVDVITHVCTFMSLSFETVDDILDTILSYAEIRDAQLRKASNTTKSDLDFIIQSLATISL